MAVEAGESGPGGRNHLDGPSSPPRSEPFRHRLPHGIRPGPSLRPVTGRGLDPVPVVVVEPPASAAGNSRDSSYKATAERREPFWVVRVDGLPEGEQNVTQGRTWAEAHENARDLVSLVLGIDDDPAAYTVEFLPAEARGEHTPTR
ncbi:hypothetical protein M2168_002920 [Streptomyces sp. CZ24]|uniref:hypothetical protein n=1 Tax=Streptomyces albidoflavus TaxID=1886 RepID=UPI0024746B6D|nr:hypothetical protein [Streptomyces sp. CZ24]MDH6189888.1 hypothetical protein [Streptomyces sp. CZ24]